MSNRKVGLVAIHFGILPDFFAALNLSYLIIPMTCLPSYKMVESELLWWLGIPFFIRKVWLFERSFNVEPDSLPSCFHPLVLFSLLKSDRMNLLLLQGSAHWVHDDVHKSSSASSCICIKHCHLPDGLLYTSHLLPSWWSYKLVTRITLTVLLGKLRHRGS